MGGKTLRTQVALYLDAEKVEALNRVAKETGRTKQDLLREALDRLLEQHTVRKAPRRSK